MIKVFRIVVFLTVLVLFLNSCVTTSTPMPYGRDTYLITTSNWLLGGITNETLNAAIRQANAHCASMGKEFVPVETQGGATMWAGWDNNVRGQLIYRCVSPNDSGN